MPAPGEISTGRKLLFSVLSTCLALSVLEGGARLLELAFPPRTVDVGLGFGAASRLYVPSPRDPGTLVTAPEKRVAFLTSRFRAVKKPGTWRIFALGESSVYQAQQELAALQVRLQERRGQDVEVIDAGGLSYGSQRLLRVATELLEDDPDVLLVYMGHNEFEELEQLRQVDLRLARLEQAASHLALFRVMRDRLADARIRELEQDHERRLLAGTPDTRSAWTHEFTPAEVAERMQAFRSNLDQILTLSAARGTRVILGTIPSNRFRPRLPPRYAPALAELRALEDRGAFAAADLRSRQLLREAAGRHQSSDVENGIIRELAAAHAVPLADVEAAVVAKEPHGIPGETLFDDHCHLNAQGRQILAATFEAELLRLP
jgi:lysophospholipase L1-like esterase